MVRVSLAILAMLALLSCCAESSSVTGPTESPEPATVSGPQPVTGATAAVTGPQPVTVATVPATPVAVPPDGPYLAQTPPGSSPVRFAPSIVRGDLHSSPVFTPDGREVYWALQGAVIMTSRVEGGAWTQPRRLELSPTMTDYRDPCLSPSGDRLFFLSKGTIPGSSLPEKENIWYVDRVGSGWGEPRPVDQTVNRFQLHWQVSVNDRGYLYFTSADPGDENIYVSRYVDGRYVEPERLGSAINSAEFYETAPFIAPDGRYLLFSRLDMADSSRIKLYISYADDDGAWGQPTMLDNVGYGICAVVSPDGKYLFFLSSSKGVSWMNTGFIDQDNE